MTRYWILGLCILCISANAQASCNVHYCTAGVKVLSANGNGKVYVELDTDMTPLDCTLDLNAYAVLLDSNARHQEIFSMLLAARMAKENILVRIVNGSNICEISYVSL